ncbi:Hypothetical predicted protein [Olea europaea subsp. europaea]|uniref:Uncharacterized protein n=1 Tax=Olea europaea subsp. europaea TaxID=158383 RepID=A0A8S0RTH8_OLEEU|nr:Hypothetical predicted protein [Olea europaea subsp. europaea]
MGVGLFPYDMAIGVALAHVHRTVTAPHIVDSNRGRRACTITVAFGVDLVLGCDLGYGSSGEKERQEAKMIVALGPIVVLVMTVTVALDR